LEQTLVELLIEGNGGGQQMAWGITYTDSAQDRRALCDNGSGMGQISQIAKSGRGSRWQDRFLETMIPEPLGRR
jgi:hypothetical protein